MKVSQIPLGANQIKKTLHNMQNYEYNPFYRNQRIKPETLSHDLHTIGDQCNTAQLKTLLNRTFINIAESMTQAKQDNIAGIIYSYLLKTNTNDFQLIETVGVKALKIAQKQKDSVHIASRANELANIYKYKDQDKYLQYLTIKRDAMRDVCTNYETAGDRYRTVSRVYKTKDAYVLTLIRTEIDIAKVFMDTKPEVARHELLSLYQRSCNPEGAYKIRRAENLEELKELKNFMQSLLTDLLFRTNTGNVQKDFSVSAKNIINAVKNKEPVRKGPFTKHFSDLYDSFKEKSLENDFISRSFEFIYYLRKNGDQLLGSKLYTIMFEKNADNPENTKIIARHGLKQRLEEKDDFGIVFFGKKLSNALRRCEKYSMAEYLDTLNVMMISARNIINNYDELSKVEKLRPKNNYIQELIYGKICSANILKNKNPEYFKEAYKEINTLLKMLPQDYLESHPKLLETQANIAEKLNSEDF